MQIKTPIYIQLSNLIKDKITNGDYQAGEALPSERKLADTYGINRLTVRAALKELQQKGIIVTKQGKGNFVATTKFHKSFSNFNGFASLLKEKGISHRDHVIFADKIVANYHISTIFNVPKGTPFYRLIRLRIGNEQPLRIEDVHIPYHLIPNIDSVDFSTTSLYTLLEHHKIFLSHSSQTLTICNAVDEPARLLAMKEGSPIYRMTFQTYDTQNRLIEYTTSLVNPEHSLIYSQLRQ